MVACVLAADQLTKWAVVSRLDRGESVELIGRVRLVHATNTGVAFSLGQGSSSVIIPVLALTAVLAWVVRREFTRPPDDPAAPGAAAVVGFALIFGGALGNIVDRLARHPGWGRGGVVDFVDLRVWPIFNVADACLVVGVLLMVAVVGLQARHLPMAPPSSTSSEPVSEPQSPAQGAR